MLTLSMFSRSAKTSVSKSASTFGAIVLILFALVYAAFQRFDPIRQKAEQGDATAQYNLGVMYDTGKGVPQDYPEARKWFLKAAEQGHSDAQYNLGVMYDTGKGVPQD